MNEIRLALLASILVLGGESVSIGQTPSLSPSGTSERAVASATPTIEFDSLVFNFGQIESGQTVRHDFIFTNSGTRKLIIKDVRISCGCTTTGAWDKEVNPGDTGRIPVEFNSTGVGGSISKSIEVFSDDPLRTNVVLQISGTVWQPIDITPQSAMFVFGPDSPTNQTRLLRIINNLDEPITISDPKSSNPLFTTELKIIRPGREYELHVTVAAPSTPTNLTSPITLRTSSTKVPVITATAFASTYPLVTLSPPRVTIPSGPLTDAFSFDMVIQNNSTKPLRLSNPVVPVLGATLSLQEDQPGRVFALRGTFPAGFTALGNRPIDITLSSNHPRFPEVKVKVVQMPATNAAPVGAVQAGAGRASSTGVVSDGLGTQGSAR